MIFYLVPPRARIDLTSFNECSFTRFKFFLESVDTRNYETAIEKLIPGTKGDQIGHFVLRCFCAYHPDVKDFVLKHEISLFFHRLETLSWNDWRKSCRNIQKQISSFNNYEVFNPIKRCSEMPWFGKLILSTLSNVCETLLNHLVGRHLRTDCHLRCNKYYEKVPFQMCLSFVKERSVPLQHGYALVPCSQWNILLVELFRHHYEFGLSMINSTILPYLSSDVRWSIAFSQLSNTYDSLKQRMSQTAVSRLSAGQVDDEKHYFPPCMGHLLKMLRTHHRLSHQWRYNFSIFLKDIGLSVEDSLEFWKTEYSKSCTAESSCTHSWQANKRKYIYSIRHLYGLEGSRLKKRSKSCMGIQGMTLGIREEGGCPFVHFDDANLLQSLSREITRNSEVTNELIRLKNANNPSEACHTYRAACLKLLDLEKPLEKFSSPLSYYKSLKLCSNSSMDW